MSMRIVLELSDNDLKHFRKMAKQAMSSAQHAPKEQVIAGARRLIDEIADSSASDFIREKLSSVEVMIEMMRDEGWGMQEVGRKRVLAALAYFNQPEDLIPDHVPGLGYLDDAIMIELLARELKPEIEAYTDFVKYRAAEAKRLGKNPDELNRSDYLKTREKELLSRMRRRRRPGRRRGGSGRSPFSLF
ncbi:MAG: YkvA family protein [Wenzhouxiangellaceae bacterium]